MKFALILLVVVTVCSCGPNERILKSAENTNNEPAVAKGAESTPTVRTFEQDLQAMRNADFTFIYVFRRRDGGVLDEEDRKFISGNTLPEMNRRTVSSDGRALIMGSNFKLREVGIFDTYKARFAFEDYSKPENEIRDTNANP